MTMHSGYALDPARKKVREKQPTRRASNKGCLPMTLDQYLTLLAWTGRQLRKEQSAGASSQQGAVSRCQTLHTATQFVHGQKRADRKPNQEFLDGVPRQGQTSELCDNGS